MKRFHFIFVRHTHVLHFFAGICFLGLLSFGPQTRAASSPPTKTWVSIYNGKELSMTEKDKIGILYLLSTFGFEFKKSDSGKIFVKSSERRFAQDTISKNWKLWRNAADSQNPEVR